MYIATIPNRNSPPAILLRESYREGKKVKTRTVANITHWPPERIEAMRRCLKGEFDGVAEEIDPVTDRIFGVLFTLKALADRLGISKALGRHRKGILSLFLVLARVADQGSRLSAVGWAEDHAVAEALGLQNFDEDDLYSALDYLAQYQEKIEARLYRNYVKGKGAPPVLVLYDVTSSYLEGECNELAEFGYNRDGKKGKRQIVIGLLTADDGEPLAVRVFKGNTTDNTTVTEQIEILRKRFGLQELVFVGDRGMVKSKGKKALESNEMKYITALTNPQIRKLMSKGVIQLGLFDKTVTEVEHEKKRLILRRNEAVREKEINRREDKRQRLKELIEKRNDFVAKSTRANPEAGLRQLTNWAKRHKISSFTALLLQKREICLQIDEDKLTQASLLDGCYVLETDVAAEKMNAATVDERYRDLQKVERDFRTLKTGLLEIRPIFVRKRERTCGHVFVAMLALKIVREMESCLKAAFGCTDSGALNMSVQKALSTLSRLSFQRREVKGIEFLTLPQPDEKISAILEALCIVLPQIRRIKL